jgi:hypothetical protein
MDTIAIAGLLAITSMFGLAIIVLFIYAIKESGKLDDILDWLKHMKGERDA